MIVDSADIAVATKVGPVSIDPDAQSPPAPTGGRLSDQLFIYWSLIVIVSVPLHWVQVHSSAARMSRLKCFRLRPRKRGSVFASSHPSWCASVVSSNIVKAPRPLLTSRKNVCAAAGPWHISHSGGAPCWPDGSAEPETMVSETGS